MCNGPELHWVWVDGFWRFYIMSCRDYVISRRFSTVLCKQATLAPTNNECFPLGLQGRYWAHNVHWPLQRWCLNSQKIKYQKIPICTMSSYSCLHCGDIFSSTKNTNLSTTHPHPCPNIAGGMAVEMVIPLQVGLEKLPTQFFGR